MHALKSKLTQRFNQLSKTHNVAFETTNVPSEKDELYELYLDSFRPEDNPIFRERREYDCNACRRFIRNIGGLVFIDGLEKISIWDIDMSGTVFEPVVKALAAHVSKRPIQTVYLSEFKDVGIDQNNELLESGEVHTWKHLHVELPDYMVIDVKDKSIASHQSVINSNAQVLKRSLTEITKQSVETVLDLITQNSIYKGEEWKSALTAFDKLKTEFETIPEDKVETYIWSTALKVGPVLSRIRNHSIGTLLTNISDGMDLTEAVSKYEIIVAPSNYKRSKPVVSARMIKAAQEKIEELGLESALQRRYATPSDININDIAFVDKTLQSQLKGSSPFDDMLSDLKVDPKKFDKVQEVDIDTFMSDILPNLTKLEAYVENKHQSNFASLIAPVNEDVAPLFKWDNNFTWAYNGNMTDSDIRENVKAHGGNVDGLLRFSLQWNDGTEHERDDLDAHCIEIVDGIKNRIFFGRRHSNLTRGHLDIDIQSPTKGKPAVENIAWTRSQLKTGDYQFSVKNYSRRSGTNGFKAQLQLEDQIINIHYPHGLRTDEVVNVATVRYNKDTNEFRVVLDPAVSGDTASTKVWGVDTQKFIPVSLVTLSPNYWGNEVGVGNKHFMFMLDGCINEDQPNGFYNEFLIQELTEHRKVFEVLGSKLKVPNCEQQLSGLGFSSTQRGELIVKATGVTERVLKIKF